MIAVTYGHKLCFIYRYERRLIEDAETVGNELTI